MSTVSVAAPRGDSNGSVHARRSAGWPRAARLLRHADFERVYKAGRRHFSASMLVFYWPRPELESEKCKGLRVGFTVGRALGGAVQRNRIKRRLREAVRLSRPASGVDADIVINPKKAVLRIEFAALLQEMTAAFATIEKRLAAKPDQQINSASRKPEAGSQS